MRTVFSAGLLLAYLIVQSQQPAKMFRDNPAHLANTTTPYDLVFDTRAWRFDAGGPVRSTAIVNGGQVYFGSANGIFYALDKKTGKEKWRFTTGKAIHSSAALQDGKLFFSDNGQTLYCLRESTGQLLWKTALGSKLKYPWRFDYYYSSPTLLENKIYIGSDDGHLYILNTTDGKVLSKFKTNGLVRSSPSVSQGLIVVGDTEGQVYGLNKNDLAVKWTYKVIGEPLALDTIGYDRKAILGAPVIDRGRVVFGARDGYLYCLELATGNLLWKVDHQVSWVISTVAIKDSIVVTGTSDGRFVQAVNLYTGNQIWKTRTPLATWASPLINNDKVYEGCYDGQLYCLDLASGKRISQFATTGIIYSSAVIDDRLLYVGSDDGYMYALQGHAPGQQVVTNRMVYYDPQQVKIYFNGGSDVRIRNYLAGQGYRTVGTDTLANVMRRDPKNSVIVFATNYFPRSVFQDGLNAPLRQFLDAGGRVVMLGNNPLFFNVDEQAKQIMGLNNRRIDSVLSLDYGPTDTRAFGGLFPGFANEKGKFYGLPYSWVSNFGIDPAQVDIVLGENENGQASAFVKKYNNGGALVQIWIHPDVPVNLDAIVKCAEWKMD